MQHSQESRNACASRMSTDPNLASPGSPLSSPTLPIGGAGRFATPSPGHRYAFVCGLHRSGTTLITRSLAEHPMISGFKGTGAIEDEGQFLQTVFPVDIEFGGAGRFGFDPRAHMTEESALNTPMAAAVLKAEWHRYWDDSKPVLIEKTPANLLRMRLLDRLFPQSCFIVVTRHPVATCLATMKWTEGNFFSLFYHWVHCYRIARADAARLERVLWISYEAFIAEPRRQLTRLSEFLGLAPGFTAYPDLESYNPRYFELWRKQYFIGAHRRVEHPKPGQRRSLLTKIGKRGALIACEILLPPYRRSSNLRYIHDALDAAAVFESSVQEFGYSVSDLTLWPDS
jgi:hypothetical protein